MTPPRYHVITLFPEMFTALTGYGVSGRAWRNGLFGLDLWNPRDFASDTWRTVDDRPFGGGPGMVMRVEPLDLALTAAKTAALRQTGAHARMIYLSPQGCRLDQARVRALVKEPALVLLCGRYEGIDERLFLRHPIEELSIGDYVLSGGELPAMVLLDALIRLLPGALGCADSAAEDSFSDGRLDCPHYTRPESYLGMEVPTVLRTGNHEEIRRWRLREALRRTRLRRPDLLERQPMRAEEIEALRPPTGSGTAAKHGVRQERRPGLPGI